MGKIRLITWREYITRVRKRSFIIMTILGPVLIALFYGLIIYLAINDDVSMDSRTVMVMDSGNVLQQNLKSESNLIIVYNNDSTMANLDSMKSHGYDGWLMIPPDLNVHEPKGIIYKSDKGLSMQTKEQLNSSIENVLGEQKMLKQGVSQSTLDSLRTNVSITSLVLDKDGEGKNMSTELNTGIGIALSMVIYMFIFLYGVQVMRGVIEEKTNRIVEVIVSSVRPFELMMGKVFGLALVGLTQILIWIILSGLLVLTITFFYMGDLSGLGEMMQQTPTMTPAQMGELSGIESMLKSVFDLNFKFIISAFIIYFIGGYLMYSALFAAIGAAVDAETETQQFMLPITLPLVFSIALSTSVVMRDPNGTLSFWLSIIPLSSPVVMMVRAPFLNLQEQWWEVLLSVGLLILSFCFTIWLAGRIYRTGILMYGKKASYKELFKWLFYKP